MAGQSDNPQSRPSRKPAIDGDVDTMAVGREGTAPFVSRGPHTPHPLRIRRGKYGNRVAFEARLPDDLTPHQTADGLRTLKNGHLDPACPRRGDSIPVCPAPISLHGR